MTRERQIFDYMFEAARNMTIAWADRTPYRIRISFEKESGFRVFLFPDGIDGIEEILFYFQKMRVLIPRVIGGHICSFVFFDLESYGKFLDEMGEILDETGGRPTETEYARFYKIKGFVSYA